MVNITGCGAYLPPSIVTNADISKMVDTSDSWIVERTGIRERRVAGEGVTSSQLGYHAAHNALSDAGVAAEDLDAVIVATSTPDMFFPSTACLVQGRLKAKNAFAFDISAACSGFIYGLKTAESLIKAGECKSVLVIGSEIMSSIVDWADRSTCILFGDGAGAVVLQDADSSPAILASAISSNGRYHDLIKVPGGGSRHPFSKDTLEKELPFIKMKGNETFRFAVKLMAAAVSDVVKRAGLSISDIDVLIPHQANLRILNAVSEKLGVGLDKVVVNVQKYGNTSAASIPIALSEAKQSGKLKPGDNVILCGFGSGLTWGATAIRW